MKKKKKHSRLSILTDKVLKYAKHIPLYNSFIQKKVTKIDNKYGSVNHVERKIKKTMYKHKFTNCISDADEYVKCKKIVLCIEDSYKQILLQYFTDYINMYNTVIRYFNKNGYDITNFRKLRTIFKDEKKKYSAPSHVLDGAIKLACASLKSALTNKYNQNIKGFLLKQIKHNKKSKIIDVEQCYLNDEYIFRRFLKEKIKNTENFNYSDIKCDSKLHYNVLKDRFTLLVPIKTKVEHFATENQISIDMGQRTFITGLTDNKIVEIGTDMSDKIVIQLNRIDKLNTIIDSNIGNNITKKSTLGKMTSHRKTPNQTLKKKLKLLRTKLRNRVKDVHWKIINYLTKTYKNITVGNWSTKDCINRETSKLGKKNKRVVSSMSVYRFRERLKYKSEARKNNLQIVDEAYTTQMCSYCSTLDPKIGASKIYNCKKCGKETDRDVNSCRNMLMLGLE